MDMVGRNDRMLLAGLAVALVVIFAKPIQHLLDVARDAEKSSGLALIPALIILTVVFVFHQQSKRQESRAHAMAAEADLRQAHARASEMERLLALGQALGRSLDQQAIRDVVLQHLPGVASTEDAVVIVRSGSGWRTLLEPSSVRPDDALEDRLARRVFGDADQPNGVHPLALDGYLCLPMTAAGESIGVIAIPETAGPFSDARQRVLGTAATLLAISIRNAQLFREVKENSLRDGLTGCFNRTHALEVLDSELRRARRSQMPFSVIIFDLDHFKSLNDRFGHQCGDAVLSAVGGKMREVLRGSDLKCRYGGEEFLVLLPETPIEGARRVADSLRREIAAMKVVWKDEPIVVTASFGVSAALPAEVDAPALIARADAALYRAKGEGRNQVQASATPAA